MSLSLPQRRINIRLMDTRQAEIGDKIHFAVMAIEASAKEMSISPMEMRRRLEKVGLVRRLLLDCYDVMHTQSLRHVAEDVVEALRNWEAAASGGERGGSYDCSVSSRLIKHWVNCDIPHLIIKYVY